MAEINPLHGDFGGLAQLAGTRTGNLGLPSWGITEAPSSGPFLQGLAGGLDNLANTVQQNQAMAQQDSQASAELAARKETAMAQRQQAAKSLELRQKQFDLQVNKHAMSLAKQERRDKLEASAASSFAIAQIPEAKWNANRVGIVGSLVKSGLVTPEEGKEYIGMDHGDIVQKAKTISLITSKATQYQSLDGDQKNSQTATGASALTPASKTAAQKGITDADETLATLSQVQSTYQKDFLGAGGMVKGAYLQGRDWLSSLPVVGDMVSLDQDEKAWLQKKSNFSSQSQGLALSYIKQLSGVQYSDKQLDFMKDILPMPTDSESVFEGKMQGLQTHLEAIKDLKSELLSQGVKYSTDPDSEYATKFMNKAQTILYGSSKIATTQGIKETADANKMTVDEVTKILKEQGYTIKGE